jgi:hypothetical protein
MRPANRGPVNGLFLVGGSAHPGGGLPMVTLSAQIVADQIGPAVNSSSDRRTGQQVSGIRGMIGGWLKSCCSTTPRD